MSSSEMQWDSSECREFPITNGSYTLYFIIDSRIDYMELFVIPTNHEIILSSSIILKIYVCESISFIGLQPWRQGLVLIFISIPLIPSDTWAIVGAHNSCSWYYITNYPTWATNTYLNNGLYVDAKQNLNRKKRNLIKTYTILFYFNLIYSK